MHPIPAPQPTRRYRIPRHGTPRLSRRLHNLIKAAYCRWLLADLTRQANATQAQLTADAVQAHQLAQIHCQSTTLANRRRDGRRHLATLAERIVAVRAELRELGVQP